MRTRIILNFLVVMVWVAIPLGAAQAHGEPVITVEPSIAPAGGQITITGTEMEPGEVFTITLEGLSGTIPLGEATVTGEGEEGGFTTLFTIPANTPPGSYTVSAAAEDGDATTTDLTITTASEEASAAPVMAREPTGELHEIDRSKSVGEIIAAVAVILLSAAGGFVLVRSRA